MGGWASKQNYAKVGGADCTLKVNKLLPYISSYY